MIVVVLVLLGTVIFFCWRKFERKHFYDLADKLPGPPGLPIVGNGLSISKYPKGILHYMIKASKDYGNVTRLWIGRNLYVFLTDPEDVEILLRDTKNIRKSSNYDYLRPWLGDGLVTSTGEHWHQNRKSLTPAFHFNILKRFVEVFNEKGNILISKLSKYAGGDAFDIFPFITLYTLDAIVETSMGQRVNIQEDTKSEYVIALNRLQEIIYKRIFNPILRSNTFFRLTKLGREHNELLDYIHGYCKKIIQKRKISIDNDIDIQNLNDIDHVGKKKRFAFLDLLLIGKKLGNGLTDNDVLDEVNTFLFAGHDTTSAAITFSIFNLAKYQDIQQKVYDEIIELFGNDDSERTIKDLQETQYLDMFVKESLRVFPPVATISRRLETDLKLKNYTIPAGASLTSFNYMVHRNEKHFPDPENFDPDRFSPENSRDRHPFAFVPFSAGPRNCIGQRYAILEIKSTLIDILTHYKILYAEEIQDIQSYIVLAPIGGVKVRLEKRN